MARRISRRDLARVTAAALLAGDRQALDRLAAYLVQSGRRREQLLLVRDIEQELARRGHVVADIVSAHPLDAALRAALTSYISRQTAADSVSLRESVDARVLGGVKITTPDAEYDATIRARLMALKTNSLKGSL